MRQSIGRPMGSVGRMLSAKFVRLRLDVGMVLVYAACELSSSEIPWSRAVGFCVATQSFDGRSGGIFRGSRGRAIPPRWEMVLRASGEMASAPNCPDWRCWS